MSVTYPVKKYISSADVLALAQFIAQRMSDVGTTNGGIQSSFPSATVPLLPNDADGLSESYLEALADTVLCACSQQARIMDTNGPGSSNSTTSASFVNMPTGSSANFTAAFAKVYVVDVDINNITLNPAGNLVNFRFLINGVGVTPIKSMTVARNDTNRFCLSFRQQIQMQAGNNTIQMQWSTGGGATAMWDATASMTMHVRA